MAKLGPCFLDGGSMLTNENLRYAEHFENCHHSMVVEVMVEGVGARSGRRSDKREHVIPVGSCRKRCSRPVGFI